MNIEVECPHCGRTNRLTVPEIGSATFRCGVCRGTFEYRRGGRPIPAKEQPAKRKANPITIGSCGIIDTLFNWLGFSDKSRPSATFNGDSVIWHPKGIVYPLESISQVILTERFLGIPGKTVWIYVPNSKILEIPRVPDDLALKFQAGINAGVKNIRDSIARKVKEPTSTEARAPLQKKKANEFATAWEEIISGRYLSRYQMDLWLARNAKLSFIQSLDEEYIKKTYDSPDEVINCRITFKSPDHVRHWWNDLWIKESLVKEKNYFDKISPAGKPLTEDQRRAILTHDNRVLAVAGAGTGKTTTAVGKVKYLLDKGYCKPEEILLMTYAKATADELKERVSASVGDGVEVRTFHSLGFEIHKQATGKKPRASTLTEQPKYLTRFLSNSLLQIQNSTNRDLDIVTSYLAYHFYSPIYRQQFKSEKAYVSTVAKIGFTTLQDEKAKSYQEVRIANWLYLHGINYTYEDPYEHPTQTLKYGQYKPDFHLTDYNVYIEHFGVDKDGNTAPGIDADEYWEGIKWKRALHENNETILIETYSHQDSDGTLFSSLESQLRELGVEIGTRPHKEIQEKDDYAKKEAELIRLLTMFLSLYKSDPSANIEQLRKQAVHSNSDKSRCSAFLDIFSHVLTQYEAELKKEDAVDFGDMITKAIHHVETGKFKSPFKVVVVDEFQDIARGRAELMESLLKQDPDTRLLCVGDDWQSIYRFSGSDVQLMTNFHKTSNNSERVDLTRTFRFNDRILGASAHFITRNPGQLVKNLVPAYQTTSPAIHVVDETIELEDILKKLQAKSKKASKQYSVFILARYNRQKDEALQKLVPSEYPGLDITAMTMHASKGQEADFVILLEMKSGGKYSFPSEMSDDPIINLLLAEKEPFANAEERRLFYVALTRAKQEVWACCPEGVYSSFIQELFNDPKYRENSWVSFESTGANKVQQCPVCDGILRLRARKKDGNKFLGCSNYPWCTHIAPARYCPECHKGSPVLDAAAGKYTCSKNCGWSAGQCPTCKDWWLVKRTGPRKTFWGCANYRNSKCKGTF